MLSSPFKNKSFFEKLGEKAFQQNPALCHV